MVEKREFEKRVESAISHGCRTNEQIMKALFIPNQTENGFWDKPKMYRELDNTLQRLKQKGRIKFGWTLVVK